jgi:hypothetical protein
MDANIELGSYSKESGLRLVWVPGYTLTVVAGADGVTVCGNSEGLRSLAQHLLTLADDVVPSGVHAHMEPGLELDDDSTSLVVEKKADSI